MSMSEEGSHHSGHWMGLIQLSMKMFKCSQWAGLHPLTIALLSSLLLSQSFYLVMGQQRTVARRALASIIVGSIVLSLVRPCQGDASAASLEKIHVRSSSPLPLSRAFRVRHFDSYSPEFCLLGCCAIILIVSYLGRRKNDSKAMIYATWSNQNGNGFVEQFSAVDGLLMNPSSGCYKMCFAGHVNVKGCMITFKMIPRHDIMNKALGTRFRVKDSMTIEIVLADSNKWSTAMLVSKNERMSKVLLDEHQDLKSLTKPVSIHKIVYKSSGSCGYDVHAEHASVLSELCLDTKITNALGICDSPSSEDENFREYFSSLHITDSYTYSAEKRVLRLIVDLPNDRKTFNLILTTAMSIAEFMSKRIKQSPESLQKSKLARETRTFDLKKNERQRKLEERQEEKELERKRKLKMMTPHQREKELARRQKIERGRRMKTLTKKI